MQAAAVQDGPTLSWQMAHHCAGCTEIHTPRGCLMLYVSMPGETPSTYSPIKSGAKLQEYSTTSAVQDNM